MMVRVMNKINVMIFFRFIVYKVEHSKPKSTMFSAKGNARVPVTIPC